MNEDALASTASDGAVFLDVEGSAHLLAVTPTAHWLEHLDTAAAIMAEPIEVRDGRIAARGPGFGMTWDERAVARYAA